MLTNFSKLLVWLIHHSMLKWGCIHAHDSLYSEVDSAGTTHYRVMPHPCMQAMCTGLLHCRRMKNVPKDTIWCKYTVWSDLQEPFLFCRWCTKWGRCRGNNWSTRAHIPCLKISLACSKYAVVLMGGDLLCTLYHALINLHGIDILRVKDPFHG